MDGFAPDAVVIVASIRALKHHIAKNDLQTEKTVRLASSALIMVIPFILWYYHFLNLEFLPDSFLTFHTPCYKIRV
jgi:hypothetical protein